MKKAKRKNTWRRIVQGIKEINPSLSFRISFNYLRFLLINGVLFFGIVGFLYVRSEIKWHRSEAEQMVVLLEMGTEEFEWYAKECKTDNLQIHKGTELLYSSVEQDMSLQKYRFGCFFGKLEDGWHFFVKDSEQIYRDTKPQEITLFYDLSGRLPHMWSFLGSVLLVYIVLMFFLVAESKGENKEIFKPLADMTETMKKLTVNNLHSERLSVQKTQKELKELTQVFNEMLDRLENSYESQKQFVSNASHELRTPIAVIQGYSRMLSRWGAQDPEILQEAIEAIGDESKAMQELVEKLLFLSRHDRKTLKVEKEWFSMGEIVNDMVKETKMVVKERDIHARLIQNVTVYGDAQLLKQAVRVLIDNAIKYSEPGDRITIGCENKNGNCVLTIEDTGIGMKKEDVNHMFERFYRSDDVRGKIEGHGLGLSIAKLIFLAHAGTMKIRTQYTKGTSFVITIPRQRMAPGRVNK